MQGPSRQAAHCTQQGQPHTTAHMWCCRRLPPLSLLLPLLTVAAAVSAEMPAHGNLADARAQPARHCLPLGKFCRKGVWGQWLRGRRRWRSSGGRRGASVSSVSATRREQRRQEAAGTKCTPRKKIAQGSARGQCPVLYCGADGGRRTQQEGAAGGREERQQEARKKRRCGNL